MRRMSLFAVIVGSLSVVFSPGCRGKQQAQQEPVHSGDSAAKDKTSQPTTAPELVLARQQPNVDLPEFPFAPGTILVNKEGYEMHEVLFLRWGNGPNEIRVGQEAEYKWGPGGLLVDDNRNIYFSEPSSGRLVKYRQTDKSLRRLDVRGAPLGLAPGGHLYLFGKQEILVVDSSGTLKDRFWWPRSFTPREIIHDVKGRIFVPAGELSVEITRFDYRTIGDRESKYAVVKDMKAGHPSRFSDRVYGVAQTAEGVRSTVRSKQSGANGILLNFGTANLSGYQLRPASVWADDPDGAVYTTSMITDKQFKKHRVVMKYNNEQKLVLAFVPFESVPDIQAYVGCVVDNMGDIYQLQTTHEGVRIVTWSRRQGDTP